MSERKIYVSILGTEVTPDRIIFSWMTTGEGFNGFRFDIWLRSIGISEDDIDWLSNHYMTNGKFELECHASKFLEKYSEDDCEEMWDKLYN